MPGEYTSNVAAPPGAVTTLMAPNYPAGSTGGPLPLAFPNFQNVPMANQVAGNVAGAGVPGFWTDHVGDCVVVAAMQRNGAAWQSYYFAHTLGGQWLPANVQLFNQWITQPQNAWLVLASHNSTVFGLGLVLNAINAGIVGAGGAPIPQNQVLLNHMWGANYGMELATGAIGEQANAPPPVKPQKKRSRLISAVQQVFNFVASKTSTQTVTQSMTPPPHAATATAIMVAYEAEYTDNSEYGLGELQVQLQVLSTQSIQATMTLRDNNTNSRQWQGSVTAQVLFFADGDDSSQGG